MAPSCSLGSFSTSQKQKFKPLSNPANLRSLLATPNSPVQEGLSGFLFFLTCTIFISVPRPWLKLLPILGMIHPPCLPQSQQLSIAHFEFSFLSEDLFSLFFTAPCSPHSHCEGFSSKGLPVQRLIPRSPNVAQVGVGIFHLPVKGIPDSITHPLSNKKTGELFLPSPAQHFRVHLFTTHYKVLHSFYREPRQDLQIPQHFGKHKLFLSGR